MSASNKLMLKDWNWRTPITDFFETRREQSRLQENYLWRIKRFERLRYEICTRWEKWREVPWDNTKAHFTNAGDARADEFYEWHRRISRSGIESQWRDCLTFPVNLQWFQVLVLCWGSTNACHLTHGICLDHRKTFFFFFCNQFSTFDSSGNHSQGIHHSTTPGATGSVPVHIGTGTPVARDEDRIWGTNPMPTFARRPSTMSSLIPVDIPKNSVVGQ